MYFPARSFIIEDLRKGNVRLAEPTDFTITGNLIRDSLDVTRLSFPGKFARRLGKHLIFPYRVLRDSWNRD